MTAAGPSLAGAAWLRDDRLRRVMAVLDSDGEEARIVGGAVRNALLGEPVGDIDIATTAIPAEVVRRARAAGFDVVPTGIDHGTVTVIVARHPFEVTTLRRDIDTDGRHATVAFGRDWRMDAERRDFTINALSADIDGRVYDPVGGLADIAARRVRFIGEAATRIREDYLRILRFFRFHAAYGRGAPDPAGVAACIAAREGLAQLSRERVRAELLKLLVAAQAVPTLTTMAEAGLLVPLIGGVPYLASAAAMARIEGEAGAPPGAMRRLGALTVAVTEDADRLWRQLRLSNAEHARLRVMGAQWRTIDPRDEQAGRALLYKLGPEPFFDRVLLAWSRAAAADDAEDVLWRDLAALPGRWAAPVFPLRAADFIARGIAKGPALGAALRAAEAAWIAADFPSGAAELAAIAERAARGEAANGPTTDGDDCAPHAGPGG